MKLKRNKSPGFSIIEMTLASVLVISISAVSYRVLKSQTSKQMATIENQKTDTISQVATSRFKSDASMIDPNWVRYGVAPIWPHQGFGLGQNFYLLSEQERKQNPVINDGVTFLRRVPQSDRLYLPVGNSSLRLCVGSAPLATDRNLYNTSLTLDSLDGLHQGDWLLLYEAGHYALGVVASITNNVTTVVNNVVPTNGNTNLQDSGYVAAAGDIEMSENVGGSASTFTDNEGTNQNSNIGPDNMSRYKSTSGQVVGGSTSLVGSSAGTIQLRFPNANETQTTSFNTGGYSNGFVTKPGVVAANFDINGNSTTTTADNSYCFDNSKANFQKVSPVSYYVDYRTSDGSAKNVNNAFMKDKKRGENLKMLVRSEYVNGQEKREYLAPIDDVGFTYDLINRTGTGEQIARDVGRSRTSSYLQNLNVSDPTTATSNFLTAYQIVAMKMNIGFTTKDASKPDQDWKQNRELKVALDPSLQKDAYRTDMTVVSSITDSLDTLGDNKETGKTVVGNEQIGKPLYLNNGSNKSEVIVPVSTFVVRSDGGMSNDSKGALYVYDPSGCAVNAKYGCNPSNNKSAITFDIGSNSRFFPNTISQVNLADGSKRIIVGGVGMTGNGSNGLPERVSGVGIITLAPNETLSDKLNASQPTSTCNIAGCKWYPITKDNAKAALVDTALIATDPSHTENIYVSTMTKETGETSKSMVYKGTWTGADYSYSPYASIDGTEKGKLVSAISDRTFKVGNDSYLAVCLTKQMSSSCGGECLDDAAISPDGVDKPTVKSATLTDEKDDGGIPPRSITLKTEESVENTLGEIQLIKQGAGIDKPGITLIKHNYRCSAINVDTNGNLIVSGRLTVQPISYNAIKNAVALNNQIYEGKAKAPAKPDILYLDEAVSGGDHTVYADYYEVDPNTYVNHDKPQYIGWLTGMSTVEFSDGTFGMVNGNKYRLASNYKGNRGTEAKEFSNAGIARIELAGMSDRVVATIQTDPNNINNSIISATYAKRSNELPSVYIPGSFWIDKDHIRSLPTPLPSVSPAMSEKSWFQLYQALVTPRDASALNSNMPMLSPSLTKADQNCNVTLPKTCS